MTFYEESSVNRKAVNRLAQRLEIQLPVLDELEEIIAAVTTVRDIITPAIHKVPLGPGHNSSTIISKVRVHTPAPNIPRQKRYSMNSAPKTPL